MMPICLVKHWQLIIPLNNNPCKIFGWGRGPRDYVTVVDEIQKEISLDRNTIFLLGI